MSIPAHIQHTLCDPRDAAKELCVPVKTVITLRRVLDPRLSFAQHAEIFPLKLSPVFDKDAFSAQKPIEKIYTDIYTDAQVPEYAGIRKQFRDIYRYALGLGGDYLFDADQSEIAAGGDQRGHLFHIDGEPKEEKHAFPDYWLPPTSVVLIVRDTKFGTANIKDLSGIKWDAIGDLKPEGRHEILMAYAKASGQWQVCDPNYIYAITNRSEHAGQIAQEKHVGTIARAQAGLRL